jgi:hypothetical protein
VVRRPSKSAEKASEKEGGSEPEEEIDDSDVPF